MARTALALADRHPTADEYREITEADRYSHAVAWEYLSASLAGSTAGVVAPDGEEPHRPCEESRNPARGTRERR
ncbi:hypothetical protein [Streptomyces sp. NPDC008125]|uniref:hypothetical protein n=1 Tax=Streptomyces sp. NPDC008125 TaxID=3364811 RepID=UPI0036E34FDA